MKTMVFYFYF